MLDGLKALDMILALGLDDYWAKTNSEIVAAASAWLAAQDDAQQPVTVAEANAWVRAHINTPQPDWSKAPHWATCHLYLYDGLGAWFQAPPSLEEPILDDNASLGYTWNFSGRRSMSGLVLPLGIDWRTTLTKRPDKEK